MKGCAAIFLDPDNGISSDSKCSEKHVSLAEAKTFLVGTKLLVIYNHLDRSMKHNSQLSARVEELATYLGTDHVFGIRYRRGTSRAFLVAAHDSTVYDAALRSAKESLSTWIKNRHFDEPLISRGG